MAAYLAAGLDGVANDIEPGEPNLGNLYEKTLDQLRKEGIRNLPQSLWGALEELEEDPVILDALGPIGKAFIEYKTREWETYDQQVTRWEVDQYLTFF